MGPLSWILTILALNGGLMAALLFATPGTRRANQFLAWLVTLISLRLVIYVLGFAGIYDDHPWITFAPLDASFAFGPLLWLYVVRLTRADLPQRWPLHFVPAAGQLAYSLIAFAMPLDLKLAWFRGPHLELIEPGGLIVMLASCIAYLTLACLRQRDYQRWLDESYANRDTWRLDWITAILAAFMLTVLVAVAAAIVNAAVVRLDYFSRTPVVIASSLLAYLLGLLGWRHAALDLPAQPDVLAEERNSVASISRPASALAGWANRIEAEQWWREEGLSLAEVARRLGTSERSLSRSLSEGAGRNFNTYINGLRIEAVKRGLVADRRTDLLSLALDCGFNSKASFNRAFLRHTGMTPSRWRADSSQIPPIDGTGGN